MQVKVLTADSIGAVADANAKPDSDDVLKDLRRDGAIATAVSTAAGAGVPIAPEAANPTLFIASPVVGAERRKGDVSTMIKDALSNGQVVPEAHARTEAEAGLAQQLVSRHGTPCDDVQSRLLPTGLPRLRSIVGSP